MTIVSVDAGSLYKIKQKKIPSSCRSGSQEQRAEQGELGRHIMDMTKGMNKEVNNIFVIELKKADVDVGRLLLKEKVTERVNLIFHTLGYIRKSACSRYLIGSMPSL